MSIFFGPNPLIPDPEVYQFIPDGNENGTWVTNKTSDDSGFARLIRPAEQMSAVVRDSAFFFGGLENLRSSPRNSNWGRSATSVPGIVSYNSTSGQWTNDTAPIPWSNGGAIAFGISTGVPSFGPRGLLIMSGIEYTGKDEPPAMNNITIYEPTTKTWKWQLTNGIGVPPGSWKACAVGAEGDNGTYEM